MEKKFYWVKIQESFFRQKEIKSLKKNKRGAYYVIVYQKMLLQSLENNGVIYFDNIEDSFEEEVALMIDEKVSDVKFTMDFLKKTDLVEIVDGKEMRMLQIDNLTGSESESANRVRKHRENKKAMEKKTTSVELEDKNSCLAPSKTSCNSNSTPCNASVTECNKNVTAETEIEKEIDIELEKDNKGADDEKTKKFAKLFEKNIKPLDSRDMKWLGEISQKLSYDLFEKSIERCVKKNAHSTNYLKKVIETVKSENAKFKKNQESIPKITMQIDKSEKEIDDEMRFMMQDDEDNFVSCQTSASARYEAS